MIDSESLITKYRPLAWDDVVGQNEVVKSLKQIVSKRSSHQFLFVGPSGVGKTTLSRIVAQELGCNNSGDLLDIDAATYNGIDDMRSITVGLRYRPLGKSTTKAIIIDEAHALSIQAWRSLLKSIEEPPEWAFWFFCTTEVGRVPDTIKTRCTKFELKPVSINDLFDLLASISDKEQFKVSDDVLDLCAKEAQGSPRQAISNLAVCADVESRKEAALLLKSALSGTVEEVDLARLLVKGATWKQLRPVLIKLKDTNPESIRQVIGSYIATGLLDSDSDNVIVNGLSILEQFSTPFPSGDGIRPVLLAIGRILYASAN